MACRMTSGGCRTASARRRLVVCWARIHGRHDRDLKQTALYARRNRDQGRGKP